MTIDDKFQFGKYSGITLTELIKKKKWQYIMYCLMNIKGFKIEPAELENTIKDRYMFQYMAIQSKTRK